MENILIKMNIIMKEILKMIRKMVKENFIVMECFQKVNGKMIN